MAYVRRFDQASIATATTMIAPSPPAMLVPPMTTAAIAVSSIKLPASAYPVETREEAIKPASPAAKPLRPKVRARIQPTRIPESRAASGLPPTA